jgi:hypothetical protein
MAVMVPLSSNSTTVNFPFSVGNFAATALSSTISILNGFDFIRDFAILRLIEENWLILITSSAWFLANQSRILRMLRTARVQRVTRTNTSQTHPVHEVRMHTDNPSDCREAFIPGLV